MIKVCEYLKSCVDVRGNVDILIFPGARLVSVAVGLEQCLLRC